MRDTVQVPTTNDRPWLTVPEAGLALGIGKSAAYQAALKGEIPTIRIGRRVVVPTAAIRRMLQLDGPEGGS